MKKKLGFILVALLVITAVAVGLWAAMFVRARTPQYYGELELPALEQPATVVRDAYGIPHISAESETDLCRALGFVNAQDRLWQLDLFRRLSQGRMAEAFGEKLISLDYRHRVLGFHRMGRKLYEQVDENSKALCLAYVGGINHYIATHSDSLPIEFKLLRYEPEPWSPEDVYSVFMWQQWMVTFNWETELGNVALIHELGVDDTLGLLTVPQQPTPTIIPETEKQYAPSPSRIDATVIPPEVDYSRILFASRKDNESSSNVAASFAPMKEVFASNAWVIAGSRTRSGKPILTNDPHIPHTLPSIWYIVRLSAPGIDDAVGIMTPGVPMIAMGNTQHIAWGETTTAADTQDLFIEQLNPENPNEYYFNGAYKPFDSITETIQYRDGKKMNAVEKEIRFSVHGPIINEIADPPVDPSTPLALRWSGCETSDILKASSLLLKATNWQQFREALSHIVTPVWNWVYADAEGNIGVQIVGRIPIRKKGQGLLPVPGWLDDYEWDGYVPYDEMPRLFNPSSGYIVTANNRVAPDDYPYLISTRFAPPYRAARIEQLLLGTEKASMEDMLGIQRDVYSKRGERLRDLFVNACEQHPRPDPDYISAVELLRNWDLSTDTESLGASIFYESYSAIARRLCDGRVRPELQEALHEAISDLDDFLLQESAAHWFDDPRTEAIETVDEIIADGVANAAESLRVFFGSAPNTWRWGNLHRLTFKHPLGQSALLAKVLNVGPFPMWGAHATVSPGMYYLKTESKPYDVFLGPSMRSVVDFGDIDKARMIITLGQSGDRLNPHYDDQLPHWIMGDPLPIRQVRANHGDSSETRPESHLVLLPAR